MKKFMPLLIVVLFFVSCNTNQKPRTQVTDKNWTAFNPYSIPFERRVNEYKKHNLVPNFSFEKGNELSNDSLITDFNLENWKIVGENIEWTNTELDVYVKNSANHEKRAVKISRSSKDISELDNQANGILSDYIAVIPGNYMFFLDVRLEKVFPANRRLNSKIGEDVDIHIEFYDKYKKRLGNGIYFEYYNKEVNNSFKGFAFSNHYYIEKFDWGRIRGRTLNYPFSEGDMPDKCKYIKIFLGLKGKGTMWVDNIDFSFSRWNFTSLERVKPYFKKDFHKSDLIIPTPQIVTEKSEINIDNKKFVVILPKNTTQNEIAALKLLKKNLAKQGIDTLKIVNFDYEKQKNEIIISIGKNDFYKKYANKIDLSQISGKKQAYVIKQLDENIFMVGENPVGNFYATTTFVQMFDAENKKIDFANIIDYPDFEGRSTRMISYKNEWTIQNDTSLSKEEQQEKIKELYSKIDYEKELIDYYAFYKINKTYNSYGDLTNQWWEPGKFFEILFTEVGKSCAEYGDAINTCVMLNPYRHFGYETEEEKLSDSLRDIFSHSSDESMQRIKNVFKIALDNNAKTVMLCADDFVPHAGTTRGEYTLFTDQDKKQFYNVAHAQNYMVNNLKTWIDANYEDIRFELCPAPYLNQFVDYSMGSAEAFFRDLTSHISKDVAIIWTGNTVRSLSYDLADIRRYSSYIKSKPMVWDNTPYARYLEGEYGGYPAHYPGKAIMCSLFEPFDIVYPENFSELLDNHYYSNLGGSGELNKIQYATFADFSWNTDAYRPDLSLYKILYSQYGNENALALIEFNDIYYKLVSVWAKIRNGKENQTKENQYTIPEKAINTGNSLVEELQQKFDNLQTIDNELLLKELKVKMDYKIKAFQKIITEDAKDKTGRRQT